MPRHEIPVPFQLKPKANPGQIKAYDTRDDRLEIATLLKHLSPSRRIEFLRWCCSQALLPGSRIHPGVSPDTVKLAKAARHCDNANERLTIEIVMDLSHMAIDYALNLSACLAHLVLMARGRD